MFQFPKPERRSSPSWRSRDDSRSNMHRAPGSGRPWLTSDLAGKPPGTALTEQPGRQAAVSRKLTGNRITRITGKCTPELALSQQSIKYSASEAEAQRKEELHLGIRQSLCPFLPHLHTKPPPTYDPRGYTPKLTEEWEPTDLGCFKSNPSQLTTSSTGTSGWIQRLGVLGKR